MKIPPELEKPIIFIGTGRSGTTIISEIIMRHPDLAYPSNYHTSFFRFPMISRIRLLFENKFWKLYGQKKQLSRVSLINKLAFKPAEAYPMWNYLTGKDIDFSRDFLLDKKASQDRTDFIRSYFRKMVRYQGRKRLSFKVTGPSRISYLLSIFPDACFVHLKRTKIPVISSFLKVDFWKSRGLTQLWWTGAYTPEELKWIEDNKESPTTITAFQIKRVTEITLYELEKHQPPYIEVNYEDFVKNPKQEILRILAFAQLEKNSSDCLTYLESLDIQNRNQANDDYFTKNTLTEIYKILDTSE